MSNFAQIHPEAISGKHNMASEAFAALRTARANGTSNPDKVSFADLIDTVNPLQHIPLVSTLYRDLTGDQISPQARIAGGALYGGPIGLVTSLIDSAVNTVTGDDIGGHVFATLFGRDKAPAQAEDATKLASNLPQSTEQNADQNAKLITASLAIASPAAASGLPPSSGNIAGRLSASAQSEALPKSATPPKTMPELSPEAFGALLNSFADPKVARDANADLAAKLALNPATDATATTGKPLALTAEAAPAPLPRTTPAPIPAAVTAPANAPVNLFSNVQSGLDKLDALKAANAKSLSLNATPSSGF